MEKFKISDIQDIFTTDVERFHSLTQYHVTHLLSEATPSKESLDEAFRQCHTLKGLAATVEAHGLSCLGADLEKLLELAGSWMGNEREKANSIFEFILEHMQDWYVMNQFTCMDMLPQAWDIYQGLRTIMDERWPGYLAAPDSTESANAHYVRLTELQIPEAKSAAAAVPTPDLDVQGAAPVASAATAGAPLPVRVVPPTLRSRDASAAPASTENLEVPPTSADGSLRMEDAAQKPSAESVSEASSSIHQSPASSEQPGAPKPLQVVPPTLRRRQGAKEVERIAAEPAEVVAQNLSSQSETTAAETTAGETIANLPSVENVPPVVAETSVAPAAQTELTAGAVPPPAVEAAAPVAHSEHVAPAAAPTTPPILRVAPPALKRRVQPEQIQPEQTEVTEEKTGNSVSSVVSCSNSSQGATPADEALSAEAIFAALPETVEAESVVAAELVVAPVVEAKAVEEFQAGEVAATAGDVAPTSGDVSDLLEMLSQEVAGYLTELTESLMSLAVNLADEEQWQRTRRLFHTIKGTAATFGLDAVAGPAKAAEGRCLAATEDAGARSREAFELCVHRAHMVAKALHLRFDEGRLREALELGLAQATNAAVVGGTGATSAAVDGELAGFFINDSQDQIAVIEQAVLRWERVPAGQSEPALEQVQAAQRGFHTIKGAGNSIGLTEVAKGVHEVEAFLEKVAAGGAKGSKAIFTFLLGAVDQLRHYLVELGQNTSAPWRHDWSESLRLLSEPARAESKGKGKKGRSEGAKLADGADADAQFSTADAPSEVATPGAEVGTLRIETARLYQLINLIGEMVIDRARLARKIEQLAGLHRALAERNEALTGSVLNFQQQFEFNLLQQEEARGAGRKGEDGKSKLENGDKGGALSSFGFGAASPASDGHGEFSELEFDRYDQFNVLARSLVEISHDIEELNGEVAACLDSFAAENVQFAQTSQQLQSRVTSLSLVPVNTLFPRLQRAFRDALNVEHKEADLVLAGGEAMLDKVVVDKVYAPLLHLLRNAAAHGIEDSVTRSRLQKPARGQVRVAAAQLSNQIVIQISDDGAGVDAAAVRERAIEKGWLPKESPALTPEQVVHFIFQPGFSTAAQVTSVSGRGIGLDVVRKEIENLNGSVELAYVAGAGSTWTLRLPLTLSISEAVLTEVGGRQFAFPLNFIEAGLVLDGASRVGEDGRELYGLERRVVEENSELQPPAPSLKPQASGHQTETVKLEWLPVLRLSKLFGLPGDERANKGLVVGVGERRGIVVVDVVLRRQEVVVKELDSVLAQHPLLNGATLDAEGRVIPILNLPTLLKFGEQVGAGASATASRGGGVRYLAQVRRVEQARVLIVDDSLSVRKVQERFLRELGCAVTSASDGLQALERLREQEFDFIFTDLEMPRMNGYELISEVRGNPIWSEIPVVVISSRGADKYITKAMTLGASTFLSKPFTQEQLKQVLGHYSKVAEV